MLTQYFKISIKKKKLILVRLEWTFPQIPSKFANPST